MHFPRPNTSLDCLRKSPCCAALLAILSLAGCSNDGTAPNGDEKVGTHREALTVCPGGPTVPGIDVSEWQGGIDWQAVAGSGVAFAITRIGDGGYMDPTFGTNWNAIKANGMIRGAYQFYEPNDDPATLANLVVGAVGQLGEGDLPVTLDVEWTKGTPVAGAIQTWIDIVTQGTGKRPMIYTAVGYWNQYFNGEFANIDLWVANWSVPCPSLPDSWGGFQFWQTGGGGTPGIGGNVDQDVFNGSLDDLKLLASVDVSQNCSAGQAAACGHYGCHCVDDSCNGGFCPGTGCTAKHAGECGNYGCGCVDGQCNGIFCPGQGCTAKEGIDCGNYGCGCVDHACSGGACPGTGCTAKETLDCKNQGMDCTGTKCVPAAGSSSSSSSSSSGGSGSSSSSSSGSSGNGSGGASSSSSSGGAGGGGLGLGSAAGSVPGSGSGSSSGGWGDAGGSAPFAAPSDPMPASCSAASGHGGGAGGLTLLALVLGLAASRRRGARARG